MADEVSEVAAPEPVGTMTDTTDAVQTDDANVSAESLASTKPEDTEQTPEAQHPIEYELKLPEGATADEALMGQYKELLQEAKVPQETAQKLMDLHASTLKQAVSQPYDYWRETQKTWQAEIKADKEVGGANLARNLSSVAKMIDSLGVEQARDFRQALNFTGAGNNPAVIKALVKLAQAQTEPGLITGGPPPGPQKTAAQKLYPEMA
jgi:hypothetical protein